jgi:hypothetical protein
VLYVQVLVKGRRKETYEGNGRLRKKKIQEERKMSTWIENIDDKKNSGSRKIRDQRKCNVRRERERLRDASKTKRYMKRR